MAVIYNKTKPRMGEEDQRWVIGLPQAATKVEAPLTNSHSRHEYLAMKPVSSPVALVAWQSPIPVLGDEFNDISVLRKAHQFSSRLSLHEPMGSGIGLGLGQYGD